MELRHLRYFVAVAEELHFGRAAKRLAISQPPLSQQILALEDELGVTLLERTHRQVRLTRAGASFLSSARQILTSVDAAVEQAKEAHVGRQGTLRVAHISGAALGLVPEAVNRHRKLYPDVVVSCQMMETAASQPQTLRSGAYDLGIVRLPFEGEGLVVEELGAEPMVMAVPSEHPLASRKKLSWSDLKGVPFVGFPRHSAPETHDQQAAFLARKGLNPHVAIEATHILNMLAYVAAGMGVTLVLASATSLKRQGVSYVALTTTPFVRTGVAYRPEAFVDLVPPFVATLRESFRAIVKAPVRTA